MQITLEQAYSIIIGRDGNQSVHIASFSEIQSTSYSYTRSQTCYHVALSDADRSYLLLVSPLDASHPQPPAPITLPALSTLLSRILDNTAVPVPRPVAHDVSGGEGKWHFGWLLLRVPGSLGTHPPTLLASARPTLSLRQLARIELRLGTHLRALHGITNDWFGIPTGKPTLDPLPVPLFTTLVAASQTGEEAGEDMTAYSWQDTFVLQLEELLERVYGDVTARNAPPSVDTNSLRLSLCRAMGSFLFDDVEMPRLIWVTGNEEDVIVSLESTSGQDTEADIAYILPTFGRALWGDPLMEAWFLPPGPTTALSEGYFGGEEDALLILAEDVSQEGEVSNKEAVRWARSILPECVETLKDAPCY